MGTSKEHKEVQLLISYHRGTDELCNDAFEMSGDDLRAMTRHLSTIRISDVEEQAVVPMKNLHDTGLRMCHEIKKLE